MNRIDYLEKELARLIGWIQSADAKVALILPISTAMLGVIAALSPTLAKWQMCNAILTSFAIFFLLLSLVFVAFASFPRTDGPKGSMIFFHGINSRELIKYKKDVLNFSEEEYIDDLINQCHINAQIADTKYLWVKRSLASLFASSIPWLLSVYMMYGVA